MLNPLGVETSAPRGFFSSMALNLYFSQRKFGIIMNNV